MLPNEEQHLTSVEENLGSCLEGASDLLQKGAGLIPSRLEIDARDHLPTAAAFGLHIAACRKMRQIIELCRIGQASGAQMISRSLFESMLAQGFVCAEEIDFRSAGTNGERGRMGDWNSELGKDRQKRGLVYFAFQHMKYIRDLQRRLAHPELREETQENLTKAENERQKFSRVEGWLDRLKKANTCAGMNVPDLAASLGQAVYKHYLEIYGVQSAFTHQSWAGNYAKPLPEGNPGALISWFDEDHFLFPSLLQSGSVFGVACLFFCHILPETDERLEEVNQAITEFESAFP